jgi:hypothetical protein
MYAYLKKTSICQTPRYLVLARPPRFDRHINSSQFTAKMLGARLRLTIRFPRACPNLPLLLNFHLAESCWKLKRLLSSGLRHDKICSKGRLSRSLFCSWIYCVACPRCFLFPTHQTSTFDLSSLSLLLFSPLCCLSTTLFPFSRLSTSGFDPPESLFALALLCTNLYIRCTPVPRPAVCTPYLLDSEKLRKDLAI